MKSFFIRVLSGLVIFGSLPLSIPGAPLIQGITEPLHDAQLSCASPGRIEKICFKEGDAVRKGDVIVELDHEAEQLEVARRRLVWEGKAELRAAEQRVATLKTDLDGTRSLFEKTSSVSREDLDKKELEFQVAVAERDRLANAEDREKIELDMAQEQLRRRQVVAPFDGLLTEIYQDVGEYCEPRVPVVRLVDCSQFYFVGNVESDVAAHLRVGETEELRIDSITPALVCTGAVSLIAPVVDPASGLQRVKVLFDNPGGRIPPGVAGVLDLRHEDNGE